MRLPLRPQALRPTGLPNPSYVLRPLPCACGLLLTACSNKPHARHPLACVVTAGAVTTGPLVRRCAQHHVWLPECCTWLKEQADQGAAGEKEKKASKVAQMLNEALAVALESEDLLMAKTLIEFGADTRVESASGKSVQYLASTSLYWHRHIYSY